MYKFKKLIENEIKKLNEDEDEDITPKEAVIKMANLWCSFGLEYATFLMASPGIADEIRKINENKKEEN
jgi:hypothetical protein